MDETATDPTESGADPVGFPPSFVYGGYALFILSSLILASLAISNGDTWIAIGNFVVALILSFGLVANLRKN